MSVVKQIADKVIEIVDKDRGKRFLVMSGQVISVEADEITAVVQLTIDDAGTPTEGILLNVKLENASGMYGIPDDGADCIVAAVDGGYELLKASSYKKVFVNASAEVVFNGGANGGVPKAAKVAENDTALINAVNALKNIFATWTPVPNDGGNALKLLLITWAAATLEPVTSGDYENAAVKH